jgi:hypothetical protein
MAKTLMDAIGVAIFNRAIDAISKPSVPVSNADAATVAREVTAAVKPIVTNATNSEPLYQSRVFLGSLAAVLVSAGDLLAMFAAGDFDAGRAAPSIATLLGAGFALYGRLCGGLKPLGQ